MRVTLRVVDRKLFTEAFRSGIFKKSFSIADDVEIRGAELKDGLLRISMEKIIPESRKRKEISIK